MTDDEREDKLFNRQEAEKLLPVLKPLLANAVEKKKRVEMLDHEFADVQKHILLNGGTLPPYRYLARRRRERERLVNALGKAVSQIEETGCVVKDLDQGLLDFPSIVNEEEVFLCWRLGEERIRYWHRPDEGFAGRKPLGPEADLPDGTKPN
ncbi:MAG TPA: DUF2203 domain-containing protein [Candidatus Acidoferrales bacterium]|nr:DUF2203 domain-containing protein [Candidatus Acidoferrales bacterium]